MAEPENDTTGQSPAGTQPSSNGTQTAAATPPEGFVEKARLDGALVKIEQLTLANRALAEQSSKKDGTIGELTAKITTLEAQSGQLAGQHKAALDELNGKYTEAQKQLTAKQQLEQKLASIKASGHPELLAIIDSLPVAENAEAQLAIANQMASFAGSIAAKREAELLAGNVDGSTGVGSLSAKQKPTTAEGWDKFINSLPIGSKERKQAFDEYYVFTTTK